MRQHAAKPSFSLFYSVFLPFYLHSAHNKESCAPVSQYCWILKSLADCTILDPFQYLSNFHKHRRGLSMSGRSKKLNASIILHYVNEQSRPRFASRPWVKLNKCYFLTFILTWVCHLLRISLWSITTFYWAKNKKKRGKEKTDQISLYTPKYSAENKLDLQCLSSPAVLTEPC